MPAPKITAAPNASHMTEDLPAIGCRDMTMPDGTPIHLCEASHAMVATFGPSVEANGVSLLVMSPSEGRGIFKQLTAEAALAMGASLIELSNLMSDKREAN